MIKKKKIPVGKLVFVLIIIELFCLVFSGILGEPGNDQFPDSVMDEASMALF